MFEWISQSESGETSEKMYHRLQHRMQSQTRGAHCEEKFDYAVCLK